MAWLQKFHPAHERGGQFGARIAVRVRFSKSLVFVRAMRSRRAIRIDRNAATAAQHESRCRRVRDRFA